jgi:1-acyl-sn-glycerol-3-phosphate acyltransferase
MRVPPPPVRRLFTVPATAALAAVAAAAVPVAVVLNCPVLLWRRPRWRLVRITGYLLLYLCVDLTVLARVAGWRLRAADGRERAAYRALGWSLDVLYRAALRMLRLRVEVSAPDGGSVVDHATDRQQAQQASVLEAAAAPDAEARRPLLVFARHAGPGDSFLLVYALLCRLDRVPRVVLKNTLQLDPGIDAVLSATPSLFIDVNPEDGDGVRRSIQALSAEMGPDDALVLFPEGGNFTENRRRRVIEHLRQRGERHRADQARRLRHVLPPRPDGALAALAGAPDADVVLVAHTGLDDLQSFGQIWRALPLDRVLVATFWRLPVTSLPCGEDERRAWLFERWAEIDAWVGRHHHGQNRG